MVLLTIFFFAGIPVAPDAHGADFFKKIKVKDNKVKVKAFGSKAKLKDTAGGGRKVKSKGPNSGLVATIAKSAAGRRDRSKAGWFSRG